MEKFIYVFNEADKNALLSRGYVLVQSPKKKKSAGRPKTKKDADAEVVEKEELQYWVFENKSVRDMVLYSLDNYVLSNTLTF